MKIIGTLDNLEHALQTWNEKTIDIWALLTQSPQSFKGGSIWSIIVNINGALKAIGLALLGLFFVVGIIKTTSNLHEIKRPEVAIRLFIRFAIAKAVVTWGMDLMLGIFNITQGVIATTTGYIITATQITLPTEMVSAVEDLGFMEHILVWAISLIESLFIIILSFVMIMTVYSRFFKLYMYTAIAPIPLSTFAGEGTSSTRIAFLKSYAEVCLEGAIIVIACIIFSAFATAPPNINPAVSATKIVWSYMGELVFNLLILVGMVKMSDRVVKEMLEV